MKEQNEESPKEAQKRYITLTDLMVVAWKDKFLIAFFSIIFFFSSIYYSLSLPDSWTSTSVVIEAQRESGGGFSGGAMSGLIGLAGIAVDTSSSGTDIALATINSRKFMRNFVINRALNDLTGMEKEELDALDEMVREKIMQSAVGSLRASFSFVKYNPLAPVHHLTVYVSDPKTSQKWNGWLIQDLNKTLMEEEVLEAEKSIEFLQKKAISTKNKDLKSLFYSMIEAHTRTVMLAEVRSEYVFKVIDPAEVPLVRSGPQRKKIVIWGTAIGTILGLALVLIKDFFGFQFTRLTPSFFSLRLVRRKDS